jgi:hypothetical protein
MGFPVPIRYGFGYKDLIGWGDISIKKLESYAPLTFRYH